MYHFIQKMACAACAGFWFAFTSRLFGINDVRHAVIMLVPTILIIIVGYEFILMDTRKGDK